jgi:hypothetical protein
MITLAIYTMNFVHPGIFLPRPQAEPLVEKYSYRTAIS